jgi:PTS system nitrogen regulatory IIA component
VQLTDLLSAERTAVRHNDNGGEFDKTSALHELAALLARGTVVPSATIERVLGEREALQSTGIGEGVAIPHGALSELDKQVAAVLTVPEGVEFQAIDDAKVNIFFAVISPKRASGEHLKTLARVSRLLRSKSFRQRLLSAGTGAEVFKLLCDEEDHTNNRTGANE